MCEANAYIRNKDGETLIMEAVDLVNREDNGIRLISIFGDQKFIKGHIESLSLVDHKIYVKED